MEAFHVQDTPSNSTGDECHSRELTSPLSIRAEFCFSVEVPESHRLVNKDLGGGSILDIGCYPLSISRHAVGAVNGKIL